MGLLNKLLGNAGAVEPDKLRGEYGNLLIHGEDIEIGFKLIRDTFIFTNKRLILVDKQGITGSKIEYTTIFYRSISKYSIETAGNFDLDAELKIWTSSETHPSISKRFDTSVNIYEVQKVLASHALSSGSSHSPTALAPLSSDSPPVLSESGHLSTAPAPPPSDYA